MLSRLPLSAKDSELLRSATEGEGSGCDSDPDGGKVESCDGPSIVSFSLATARPSGTVCADAKGQLDSPLTAKGKQQANAVASLLMPDTIDLIFSSPLDRAYQTALIVAATVDRTVNVLDDLTEMHHGTFAGLTYEEIEAAHPGVLRRREAEKYKWRFPGGESYADADARASRERPFERLCTVH